LHLRFQITRSKNFIDVTFHFAYLRSRFGNLNLRKYVCIQRSAKIPYIPAVLEGFKRRWHLSGGGNFGYVMVKVD
jgi:hypothetical protein